MKKKTTVSIGIPAYNEEANIYDLLIALTNQKEEKFIIKEVLILNDGSSDKTIENVKRVNNERIKIINKIKRKGKVKRMTELFKIFNSEVLIQIDADLKIIGENACKELVNPFIKNKKLAVVYGVAKPYEPKSYIENIFFYAYNLWNDARKELGNKGERYYCSGQVRAFSHKYFKNFKFPNVKYLSEDGYIFMYCKENKFPIKIIKKPIAYSRLSSSVIDYVRQMSRYSKTPKNLSQFFLRSNISNADVMTKKLKLKVYIKNFLKSSILISLGYVIVSFIIFINRFYSNQTNTWKIAITTKRAFK